MVVPACPPLPAHQRQWRHLLSSSLGWWRVALNSSPASRLPSPSSHTQSHCASSCFHCYPARRSSPLTNQSPCAPVTLAPFIRMSRPGDELAELLWDNGPALRATLHFPPAPFQPFTCSAAGSSRAHELNKRYAVPVAGAMNDDIVGLGGIPVHHHNDDDDAVPWLHCPVIDDGDSDTAPLPPEYCAGLLSDYPALHAVPPEPDPTAPGIARPSSHGAVVIPATRAVPAETVTAQPQPSTGGEGVMNFTFFSRPLQRPKASAAASPSNPPASTVVQTAASRLRNTPLFSEQRMAWLQPPKGPPRATAVAPPAPQAPPTATDHRHHHHVEAATTVTQHRLQPPDARAPDATAAVMTSSVCSGNGDRIQAKRSSHQPTAECSVSQDEDMDDDPGAVRRSAARGTKRSRTAEVHNLSERRRRDRINEKMRALQELIPNCNKIDKASMLEEAIEYLKNLQLQVQMMSMGTGLCVPPMLMQMPPMAPFPHLGMGLGFGMGPFDMLPCFAGAQFPCPVMPGAPPMAMPPGSMFGLPGQVMPPSPAAPFPHMNGATSAEQREAASVPASGGAGAGDHHPPVPVAPHQGDQKLQHPKKM